MEDSRKLLTFSMLEHFSIFCMQVVSAVKVVTNSEDNIQSRADISPHFTLSSDCVHIVKWCTLLT